MDAFAALKSNIMYPTAIEAEEITMGVETRKEGLSSSTTSNHVLEVQNLPSTSTTWSVDGFSEGIRFFAIPTFARNQQPRKIDVVVPEFISSTHPLRRRLNLDALLISSSANVASCKAAQHVVAILEHWSSDRPGWLKEYHSLPYGSQIIIENVREEAALAEVHFVPDFTTERSWLSVMTLKGLWQFSDEYWPATLNISELCLVKQPHDAISLVRIRRGHEILPETLIFKSVLRDLQHFYHELRLLLEIPSHLNVISRPRYLVTQKARFGSKVGVCGFVLEYHVGGTLQDYVLHEPSREDGTHLLGQQFDWARQLTEALIHIRDFIGFYANLKLINIVMDDDRGSVRPILIDFEQRCGWFSWSAPEIHYVNYLEQLAEFSKDVETREYYTALLRGYIPDWKPLKVKARYTNPKQGYCSAWLALTPSERESAQVFMLGKLLWCIFESVPSMSSCVTVETLREPCYNKLFPEFHRTPDALRDCVRRCTAGAPEWDGILPAVVRRGNSLDLLSSWNQATKLEKSDVSVIQQASKSWWVDEIARAERFIRFRSQQARELKHEEDAARFAWMKQRPTLEEVLTTIDRVAAEHGIHRSTEERKTMSSMTD